MIEALAVIVAVAGLCGGAVLAIRAHQLRYLARSRRSFRLQFPRDLRPEDAIAFVSGLAGVRPRWWQRLFVVPTVILEVRADAKGVVHWLHVPAQWAEYCTGQLRGGIPSIQVANAQPPHTLWSAARELRTTNWNARLRVGETAAISRSLLACFHPLGSGEEMTMQLVLAPATLKQAPEFEAERELADALLGRKSKPFRVSREQRVKISSVLFLGSLRLAASAPTKVRSRELVNRLRVAFYGADTPQARLRERALPMRIIRQAVASGSVPLLHFPNLLNAEEVAALSAIPMDSPVLPGVELGGARQLPPLASVGSDGRMLGLATFPGGGSDRYRLRKKNRCATCGWADRPARASRH